ncbi:MAG: AsmA family protein [Kiritimatiellae bacterium]|nr:AsmA family protein [Kiritimatiellia bacterium]
MKWLGKLVKRLFGTLVLLVVLVLAAVLSIPFWIGPVVRPTVNRLVPEYTQTGFFLGNFKLNPYTCYFEMGELRLGNPEGFAVDRALSLGKAVVDVETLSLFTDIVVIENIEISDAYVAYVKNGEGKLNFDVIGDNVKRVAAAKEAEKAAREAAAKEAEEAPAGERGGKFDLKLPDEIKLPEKIKLPDFGGKSEGESVARAEQAPVDQEAAAPEQPERQVKYIIRRLAIKNVSGQYLQMPFKLPSFELHNLGFDEGGYSLERLSQAIINELVTSIVSSLSGFLNTAVDVGGKSLNEAVKIGTEGLSSAMDTGTEKLSSAMDASTEKLSGAVGAGSEKLSAAVNVGVEGLAGALGKSSQALTGAVNFGQSAAEPAVAEPAAQVAPGAEAAPDAQVEPVAEPEAAAPVAEAAEEDLRSTGRCLEDAGKSALNALVGLDGQSAKDAFKSTGDSFKSVGKDLKGVGKDLKNIFKNKQQ